MQDYGTGMLHKLMAETAIKATKTIKTVTGSKAATAMAATATNVVTTIAHACARAIESFGKCG